MAQGLKLPLFFLTKFGLTKIVEDSVQPKYTSHTSGSFLGYDSTPFDGVSGIEVHSIFYLMRTGNISILRSFLRFYDGKL